MIPNATQERAEKLLELYSAAEALLLQKIASRLKIGKTANAPLWVQKKLREIDALKRELQGALDRLEKAGADERIALMWAAHDEGADGLRRELNLPEAQAARSQAVVSLIDDMEGRFSELHRRILRDAQDVYRDVLYQALPMAAMGVETTRQALQRALNAFADRGITGFVDKAGRHWGIAEYAEMATRTGMMNAALAGYTQEALNHDEDLVIISDHADECPLCAPWERKVLSLTGAQQHHPDCQGVLADARAAGLFHPNCLHSMTVYVPGLTDRTGSKERAGISAEADAAGYNNRQQQRYMERTVRKWKRRQAVAMTPEEERYAKAYVDRWQARLRSFTGKGAKLPRKYDREGGRVLLSDAAKKLKPLQISDAGVIIKPQHPKISYALPKNLKSEADVRRWIQSEACLKTVNIEKQNRHMKDIDGYIPGRSYFNGVTVKQLQDMVDRLAGSGGIRNGRDGIWNSHEEIEASDIVGFCVDPQTGEIVQTHRFIIHYSKTGVHIVPVKPL